MGHARRSSQSSLGCFPPGLNVDAFRARRRSVSSAFCAFLVLPVFDDIRLVYHVSFDLADHISCDRTHTGQPSFNADIDSDPGGDIVGRLGLESGA